MARGELLETVWCALSPQAKYGYARQLRKIVAQMRGPKNREPQNRYQIGSIYSGEYSLMLDRSAGETHWAIEKKVDEAEFAKFLLSRIKPSRPEAPDPALASDLGHKSTFVLTHGNLGPKNIIVRNSRIEYIIGWDCTGWYPDWWEYVKFFDVPTPKKNDDWFSYARDIFEVAYPRELAAYSAVLRCAEQA